MPEALLEVEDVHSGYGAGDILQGVSLSVRKGEIVAVVGRNGVGKTTLMRTVMGLLPLRAGAINHHGRPIVGLSPQARAKAGFGYVPQGKMIFPFLTVAENLKMGERVGGAARPWDQIFDMFPILRERLGQQGGTLSGGQQQALAIARVLVGSPEILILDEPSESIQPNIIADIGRVLARLNAEQGQTIVLVENNFSLIRATAHRAYVLDRGRCVAELAAEEVSDRERMLRYLSV
ncbi:MAG: ABC transporter ATP-binding protein [Rhizobiales bacterium]|jgi:branched-chain amino acid transport system ATP-binding protein|nr:ABC transporter ATP-binding protein [Hyphomicrobiales bacterium]